LDKQHITFAVSRVPHPLPETLEHYELLDRIGKNRLYHTNRAAVEAYLRETGTGGPLKDPKDNSLDD